MPEIRSHALLTYTQSYAILASAMTERLLARLQTWRQIPDRPLTQGELGALLGVTQPHLSRVLRGERRLSDRLLRRLRTLAAERGDAETERLAAALLLGEVPSAA